MLFNTTYKNEEFENESNRLLGRTFSFLEKLKMRGVGSHRFVIAELSPSLTPPNRQHIDINFANIELRPKGIIIHFSNRLDRYSWVIPYFRLAIFSTETYTIHGNGKYIKFKKDKNYLENKAFIKKMAVLKTA